MMRSLWGGGPAGASCAAFCARAGWRVLVLERAIFPREKVCGDCLNPDCWPVLARLGLEEQVRALPHARLHEVEFVSLRGRRVQLPLPDTARGEIAVKRSLLDALLLAHAASLGAEVRQDAAVMRVACHKPGDFEVEMQHGESVRGRWLLAADGRNSVVARLTGLAADPSRPAAAQGAGNRVGLQTHIPCPAGYEGKVQMRWFAEGYGGLAPVGGGELNISLAGPARTLAALKSWAYAEFAIGPEVAWRTIAPLDRWTARVAASEAGVFLLGDAARVVEPFTGEGIYYALRSGELAAKAIVEAVQRNDTRPAAAALAYRRRHAEMYKGRLWVNRLARAAVLHPGLASLAVEAARWHPGILRHLTRKVVPIVAREVAA